MLDISYVIIINDRKNKSGEYLHDYTTLKIHKHHFSDPYFSTETQDAKYAKAIEVNSQTPMYVILEKPKPITTTHVTTRSTIIFLS